MPALIFHQNMRVYGGGTPLRNAAFNAAFNAIRGVTGAYYWAAGFTEVMNAGPALRVELSNLAQALDPGLTRLLVIEVGSTAVGATREYIGIAWDPGVLNVQHAGHVLRNANTRSWGARDTAVGAPGGANVIPLPPPAVVPLAADARGMAYIAGMRGATPYLIAFMHNMYGVGDRLAGFSNLGLMADRARRAAGGVYVNARVVVGGDFNVLPRPIWHRVRQPVALQYRAARVGVAGAYVLTTQVHTYDFWATDLAIDDTRARVHTDSRIDVRPDTSDHAGISLSIV